MAARVELPYIIYGDAIYFTFQFYEDDEVTEKDVTSYDLEGIAYAQGGTVETIALDLTDQATGLVTGILTAAQLVNFLPGRNHSWQLRKAGAEDTIIYGPIPVRRA